MQENPLHIATAADDAASRIQLPLEEGYAQLLIDAGIDYSEEEVFLAVRPEAEKYDWCLCLSVVRTQITDLLGVLLPLLREYDVPFRVAKNKAMALQLQSGKRGGGLLNRLLIVYPTNNVMASTVARILVDATQGFNGPDIPAIFHLGGVVFTQLVRSDPSGLGTESWPFEWVNPKPVSTTPTKFRGKYRIVRRIKESVKGNVYEAVYLKRMLKVDKCLIKQGKKHMWSDDDGRDISQRLQWQHQIQLRLNGLVDLPGILDFFTENGDTYLVMNYVKGPSVKQMIDHVYKGRHWNSVISSDKKKLLSYLLRIIDIVETLHQHGIVHRDLTPSNFLIDRKDRIVMIDLEMAYSVDDKYPFPPFTGGTNGFASPQQAKVSEPTFHEDMYAIGGMLTNFFTGLQPVKFERENLQQLVRNLFFFCGDREIAITIANCFHSEPSLRPSLAEIRQVVENYVGNLSPARNDLVSYVVDAPGATKLKQLISRTFRGITFPGISMTGQRLSHYPAYLRSEFIGYLMVMDAARSAGVNGYHSPEKFDAYRQYINKEFFNSAVSGRDLYAGAPALALGVVWAMKLGILPHTQRQFEFIRESLDYRTDALDLFSGVAGKGMAMLIDGERHQANNLREELRGIIVHLGKEQEKDGSWPVKVKVGGKSATCLGLMRGVAGIVYFLLECYEHQKIDDAALFAKRGLKWLEGQAIRSGGGLTWKGSSKKSDYSLLNGSAGITAVFIKAYDVLKVPGYRVTAQRALCGLPDRPVWSDYSLGTGLAGIGAVYTYAARVFHSPSWMSEAGWIASVFLYSFQNVQDRAGRWNMDGTGYFGNDLLTGNAGIIFFLIMLKKELELPKMEQKSIVNPM